MHGLWRVRDGLPLRGDDLCLSAGRPTLGAEVRTLLATYRAAGGRDPCLLFHDAAGRELILRLGRHGRGLPARVIPVQLHHVAAAGIDTWLGALAYGAGEIAVLTTGAEAPQYAAALAQQLGFADAIAQGLGYQGSHTQLIRASDAGALEAAVWALEPALAVRAPATFHWTADKRATLALAVEHLVAHAPTPRAEIAARCRRAVRNPRGQPRHVHNVLGLRRVLPRGRAPRSPAGGGPAVALHRDAVRAMRPVRGHLSGRVRSRSRRGCCWAPRRARRVCSTRR